MELGQQLGAYPAGAGLGWCGDGRRDSSDSVEMVESDESRSAFWFSVCHFLYS